MNTKLKLLGHPVHPMLIVFPLGLLSTAVIFDVVGLFSGESRWVLMAYYLIAGGVVGGLVAAVFGTVDWVEIPRGTRAKYIGTLHGIGNVVVVALFAASWLLRRPSPEAPSAAALLFSFLGLALALGSAWLGGELVNRLGVSVEEGAHLNSPSSLSGRPAGEGRTIGGQGGGFRGPERRQRAEPAYAGVERRAAL